MIFFGVERNGDGAANGLLQSNTTTLRKGGGMGALAEDGGEGFEAALVAVKGFALVREWGMASVDVSDGAN